MTTDLLKTAPGLLLALGLALPGAASAADDAAPRYYLGLQAGTHNLSRWDGDVSLGAGVSLPGKVSLDEGMQGGVLLGRQTENARYEIEYQRGNVDLQSIQLGPQTQAVGGSGRYEALTLNAYRSEALTDAITAYLGAGVGWGKAKLPGAGFDSGCHCFPAATGDGLAYQLRAGLEYGFGADAPHKAFIQYTHLSLPGASSGGSPGVDYDRKTVGTIGLGYRYVFR